MNNELTEAQNELYEWIKNYIKGFNHSPSIRQMMEAMGLKSPAPIQIGSNIYRKKVIYHGKKEGLEHCN